VLPRLAGLAHPSRQTRRSRHSRLTARGGIVSGGLRWKTPFNYDGSRNISHSR
jgi:hypothetical protein